MEKQNIIERHNAHSDEPLPPLAEFDRGGAYDLGHEVQEEYGGWISEALLKA